MATLATAALVKAQCNLPNLPDGAITPWLDRAQAEVISFIGGDIYAALQAQQIVAPYAVSDLARVTRGEVLLAGSLSVLAAGVVSSGQGLMAVAGGSQGGPTTLPRPEVVKIAAHFQEIGYAELGPYRRDYLATAIADGVADPAAARAGGMRFRASKGVTS